MKIARPSESDSQLGGNKTFDSVPTPPATSAGQIAYVAGVAAGMSPERRHQPHRRHRGAADRQCRHRVQERRDVGQRIRASRTSPATSTISPSKEATLAAISQGADIHYHVPQPRAARQSGRPRKRDPHHRQLHRHRGADRALRRLRHLSVGYMPQYRRPGSPASEAGYKAFAWRPDRKHRAWSSATLAGGEEEMEEREGQRGQIRCWS